VIRRKLLQSAVGAIFATWQVRESAHAEEWIVGIIYEAAARHGVSGDWLLSTATCESGLNPWAYNPETGDSGLFQFKPDTWAGWGGDPASLWDVWSQADMAAWAFANGLHSHWCCSGTWAGWESCG